MTIELLTVGSRKVDVVALTIGHCVEDLPAEVSLAVSFFHATCLDQIDGRLRLTLGDSEHGKVGQDLTDRHIDRHRPSLTPLADGPGHPAGPWLQHAYILDPQPGLAGVGSRGRAQTQLLTGLGDPLRASELVELDVELIFQGEEMVDVGSCVGQLLVRQRAPEPVGQSVALGGGYLQLGHQQRHQRRGAVAQEPGGQLRVVHHGRHGATGVGQDIEVLLGSVKHRNGLAVEQPSKGSEIDSQWIDQCRLAAGRELHQGELREVCAFPMEFGVEGVPRLSAQFVDERVEIRLRVDPAIRHAG